MKKLVICDREEAYAKRLAEAFAAKKEILFEIFYFSSIEHTAEYQKMNEIAILLINDKELKNKACEVKAEKIFLLTEMPEKPADCIYKYQSVEAIFQSIAERCIEDGIEYIRKWNQFPVKTVGVYSPVRRCGKTTFAMEFGKELAKKKSVLYLNLDVYGQFHLENTCGQGKTLTDLLYYSGLEDGRLGFRLGMLAHQYGEMDYVLPCKVSLDLKAVLSTEWSRLLGQLRNEGQYEILLLEIGECIQGFYEMLEQCGLLYMPVLTDGDSLEKIRSFEEELKLLGKEELSEHIRKIELLKPVHIVAKETAEKGEIDD